MALFVKKRETGEVVQVSKYILGGDGLEHIWSHEWYGHHILGDDCDWCDKSQKENGEVT